MKKPVFCGSATAMITPFTPEGELALNTLGKLIDRQIEGGTDALVVCATTGECATLQDREWETVVSFSLERAAGRVPVIAGIGRNDTRHTIWLNKRAKTLGVQGVLAVTPYYNKTSQTGLVRHFEAVADSANLPLILYNVPSRTGMSFSAESYRYLSRHPNIFGVKEASGDFTLLLKTRFLCDEDFALYSGNDDQIVAILSLGGLGVISTVGNVVPEKIHRICTLWKEGKREEAAALQIRLQPLIEGMFREVNPIPVKAALREMGLDSGYLRQPLTEISPEALHLLKNTMSSLELI